MSLKQIRFGTSGWRGIIADDFTFESVTRVVTAIANTVRERSRRPPCLVVGYDTRFLSEEFAGSAAEILEGRGVHALLCRRPTPTPALAYEIVRRGTEGGINFTASHNPPEYNGLKFSTADGAPALPEVTRELEKRIQDGLPAPRSRPRKPGGPRPEEIEPAPAYQEMLAGKVRVRAIREARLRVVYDPLYGAGSGYLDGLLRQHGVEVETLHTHRDVRFGGHAPEPAAENLTGLREALSGSGAAVGLSTDGDADRFGVLDRDGRFVSPNYILGLLLDYLLETRPDWPRGVARSVSTSHLVDAVARAHGIPVYETPVGFKYIGKLIQENRIALGGEESAGLSIAGHLPEKDGILACLLVAEMVACRRASLGEQLEGLFRRVGPYYPVRINLHLPAAALERAARRLEEDPETLDGRKVTAVNRTDGLKLFFADDSWVLLRLSGTEPVVRCYCESHSPSDTRALVEAARKFLEV